MSAVPEPPSRPEQRSTRSTLLMRWHRRIGLGLAAIFVLVVATGMLLNHAEGLDLRHRAIEARWLYRWYGMEPSSPAVAFQLGERWVGGIEGIVVLGDRTVTGLGPLVGAVEIDGLYVAASNEALALLTPEGELVEKLGRAALPAGRIEAIAASADGSNLLVRTTTGIHSSDTAFASWTPVDAALGAGAEWSVPVPPSPDLQARLLDAWRGQGLTVHRLILDLHSGRFFGRAGPLLMDAAALGLLLLVLTGVWFALSGRRPNTRRP